MCKKLFWVVLANSNTQPLDIDATDCISLSQFKEAIKKAYSPALDTISSALLTLRTSDGNIILPSEFLNSAINHNSYESPFSVEVTRFSISGATAFEVTKNIKPIWVKSTGSYPALSLNMMSQFFEIPAKYLEIAKLPCGESNLVLFRRQNFQEQFEFIDKEVIRKSMVGWILGPPGTGKSSAAYAFITTLDKDEWTVTWLHCSDNELQLHCIQLTGDSICTCKVNNNSVSIHNILYRFIPTKKHLFILDGYTGLGKNNSEIMSTCKHWFTYCLLSDENQGRLLIVSSMAGRMKRNITEDNKLGVKEFFVYSWNLKEYLMAVKYDSFLKNFKNYSNCITDSNKDCRLSLEDLIRSKFYYAGGNCRYMFMLSIADVKNQIDESISECDNINLYIAGFIGDRSSKVINRLYGSHLVEGSRKFLLVSDYAASVMEKRVGLDTIQKLVNCFTTNPSMNGWLFEEWVFSLLCHNDLYLYLQGGQLGKVTWPKCNVIHKFNPRKFSKEELNICVHGAWFRPLHANPRGYDAVYINKIDGYVRFLQITRSKSPSFFMQHFYDLLERLVDHFEIKTLEICFVVPIQNLNEFKIKDVGLCGRGLLVPFGWEMGKEIQKIKRLGIYGWT